MEGSSKADKVRLWRYRLPLDAPVSLGRGEKLSVREGVIVEAMVDGESHLGEAAPLPGFSRERLDDSVEQLRHLIAAAPGLDLSSASVFRGSLLPSVDFALWGISASLAGEALSNITLCGLLSGDQDEMTTDALRLSKAGYRTLKVKVGRRSIPEDAGAIHRIAAATGDGVRLRLDANRSWSMSEAMRFASLTEPVLRRVEFIEEPLANGEPESLRTLSEESGMPIALDETLQSAEPGVLDGGRYDFVRAVVLKPQLLGATKSLAVARRASLLGADIVVSASYESGVGIVSLLRFARECAVGEPLAPGLDTYRRLREDVLGPPLDLSGPIFRAGETSSPKLRYDALERLL